ncbi:MAG: response regulator [Desulforhopalus sp.]|nr:response regulator [Desulforhopalus sp.]
MADYDELTGVSVNGIPIEWHLNTGTCTFGAMPAVVMRVDSTLARFMAETQAMMGTERFTLALQSEGRKSIADDWPTITACPNFTEGFQDIAHIYAAAGWGNWQIIAIDYHKKEVLFRVHHSWEGRYQQSLGVNWGCAMLAGKLAGYCSRLFDSNCWAEQLSFTALGDDADTFLVKPSTRTIENELTNLLATGAGATADATTALRKLQEEIQTRAKTEQELRLGHLQLEQRMLEQAGKYSESERKYRDLVEGTNDLVAQLDPRGRLTFLNRAAQKILTLAPAEYSGLSIFRFIHPDDHKRVLAWWRQCLADKADRTVIELRQVNIKTGNVLNLQWSTSFQYDAAGKLTGIGVIGRDVSDIRRAEQERESLAIQLRRRHKMEAIGTLAGGIAHDFNNILAAVLGYADMALADIPVWSPARRQIQEVLKAGNRAKDLVKQILAFSRKEEQHRQPINLNALIVEAVVFLRATIPTTIDIMLDLAPGCGNIQGDQTQIHQVLMNLCTNASQAMENQGGTLTIALREVQLFDEDLDPAGNLKPGKFVLLTISDTGSGIPEKYLERIFDPYFTTKEFGKGSGMGLAVAHGIVKSHDGMIRVTNKPGEGAAFSLFFPRIDAVAEKTEETDAEHQTGNERILVVDDDPSIAKMLEIVLSRHGYSVHSITSSTKALEVFRSDPGAFDLVLTDMTMPELTGDNLAEEIRRIRPDVPIILCTGYSRQIDDNQARAMGIRAFLMKPVDLRELAATVRRLIDES